MGIAEPLYDAQASLPQLASAPGCVCSSSGNVMFVSPVVSGHA